MTLNSLNCHFTLNFHYQTAFESYYLLILLYLFTYIRDQRRCAERTEADLGFLEGATSGSGESGMSCWEVRRSRRRRGGVGREYPLPTGGGVREGAAPAPLRRKIWCILGAIFAVI